MLLTRYTFVNTLRRITPLVLDWTVPMPLPDLARKLPVTGAPSPQVGQVPKKTTSDAIVARQLASQALPRHHDMSEAADRRGRFMARLSRRVIKNSLL